MTSDGSAQVTDAIRRFFAERTQGPWMVSTGLAVRKVRAELPDCPLDDRQIEALVAEYAVARGLNVSLDSREG